MRLAFHSPLILLGLVFVPPVWAHGGRLPFLFWGGFPRSIIPCQRALGDAARLCALGVASLRLRCSYRGANPCTPEELEQQRKSLEIKALDLLSRTCTDRATVQLGFLGVIEAQSDIANVCAKVNRDLFPIVGLNTASPPAVDCAARQASAAMKLLRVATKEWHTTLDRIAYRIVPPSRKTALLAQTRERVGQAADKLGRLLEEVCASSHLRFSSGRPPREVLTNVLHLAECVTGAAYVQDAVHCDPPSTSGQP